MIKKFTDIEVAADTGQIRLYASDKDYGDFNSEELLEFINHLLESNKTLEKHCHLLHIASMFSTVKSFKGDVSKRYKYSEKTDVIYDTANHYGAYDKILDKKEITMLLNEYETIIKDSVEDK